jgi:hypothetical protein
VESGAPGAQASFLDLAAANPAHFLAGEHRPQLDSEASARPRPRATGLAEPPFRWHPGRDRLGRPRERAGRNRARGRGHGGRASRDRRRGGRRRDRPPRSRGTCHSGRRGKRRVTGFDGRAEGGPGLDVLGVRRPLPDRRVRLGPSDHGRPNHPPDLLRRKRQRDHGGGLGVRRRRRRRRAGRVDHRPDDPGLHREPGVESAAQDRSRLLQPHGGRGAQCPGPGLADCRRRPPGGQSGDAVGGLDVVPALDRDGLGRRTGARSEAIGICDARNPVVRRAVRPANADLVGRSAAGPGRCPAALGRCAAAASMLPSPRDGSG